MFEKISKKIDILGFDASLEIALFSNFLAYTVLVPTLDLEIAHICFYTFFYYIYIAFNFLKIILNLYRSGSLMMRRIDILIRRCRCFFILLCQRMMG